jgi:outer membrane protein OmpA-like peptidoglycan-associated protein/ferritin-like metal-binding protein YciE
MPEPQLDYAANVEKYVSTVDTAAVKGIVKYLGIALYNRDSSLVAASDPSELKRVRDSFMKKKLGLMQTDAELDAVLKDVMTTMSGEHNKNRVTVYYLLAEKFGKLGLFANPQAVTAMEPTKASVTKPVETSRELFVMLLSSARQNTECSAKIYKEISLQAQNPDIKELLESRAWIADKDLSAIDRCFQLIGEQPVQLSGRVQDEFVEDLRKNLMEIQNPVEKDVFFLARASHLGHLRVAEYEALVEAADLSGHYAVGVLLESCLAHKLVFLKRTRHFINTLVATDITGPAANAIAVAPDEETRKDAVGRVYQILWPILAIGLFALLGLWIWKGRNAIFDANNEVQLATQKATSAVLALKPGFGASELVSALNMEIINFAKGSAEIPAESNDFLNQAAIAIKAAPPGTIIEIDGHTDNTGDAESNLLLSQQRALAVRNYLVMQGVDESALTVKGSGENDPVASNETDEGRFRNRRIQFNVVN